MVFNKCSDSRRFVSFLTFAVWKSKLHCSSVSLRLYAFLVLQKGQEEEAEERAPCRKLDGRRMFAQSQAGGGPQHLAEGTQRRLMPLDGETQPQVSFGGVACWWPVGGVGLGGTLLADAVWRACLFPTRAEGAGGPATGRG